MRGVAERLITAVTTAAQAIFLLLINSEAFGKEAGALVGTVTPGLISTATTGAVPVLLVRLQFNDIRLLLGTYGI